MRTQSLRRQLIGGLLIVEICCALSFTGVALLHEWHIRIRALDTVIKGRSDSLLGAIQDAEDPGDNVVIDPTELVLPGEDVYAVYADDGRLIGSSPGAPKAVIARRGEGFSSRSMNGRRFRTLERGGIRVIDRPENGGVGLRRRVTVVYAVESRHIWFEVFRAASFYVAATIALVVLSAAGNFVLLRQALLPIQELASAAGDVSFRALSFVPPGSALRVEELRPLAETLSGTVTRLKQSVDQQNRLVGDAAHELKTAVAIVRSSIQLLMMRPREAAQYFSGLQELLNDNARVEELVLRMLVTARFEEQGGDALARAIQKSDLAQTSARVIERLQPLLNTRHVSVHIQSEREVFVQLLEDEVDVLISNLIVNAAQHSAPEAHIEVNISKLPVSALLIVEDHGDGISPAALPHVFDRFFRADISRSRETGGAGLGLSICKSIVEAASGTISVRSAEGVGTTVTVSLPRIPSFTLA